MPDTNTFWGVLVWTFWIFIWISAIFIWFRCLFDMFSDHTLSGWAKTGWAVLLVFVPWLGAFIYLIARGKSMGDRQARAASDAKAQQDAYIKSVAGSAQTPTQKISDAKALLDAGTITQEEFDGLKAKALA